MARNASGIYSLPNPAVIAGTTIDADDENETRSDMATELTNSLDRNGRGSMLAALKLFDGTVGAPGLSFGSDTDNGIYRSGADAWSLVVAGAAKLSLAASGISVGGVLTVTAAEVSPIIKIVGTVGNDGQMHFGVDEFGGYIDPFNAAAVPPWPAADRIPLYLTGQNVELWIVDGTDEAVPALKVNKFGANAARSFLNVSPGPNGGLVIVSDHHIAPVTPSSAGIYFYAGGVESAVDATFTFAGNVGGADENQFIIACRANAVNHLTVGGSATGDPLSIVADGLDANVDIAITPRGTGLLKFGAHTGSGDVAISGFITIKDAAGNNRKLAVIT